MGKGWEFFFGAWMGMDSCFLFEKGREVLIWSLIEYEVELGSAGRYIVYLVNRDIHCSLIRPWFLVM